MMKSAALVHLDQLSRAEQLTRYPGIPESYLPAISFTDRTANELTRAIIRFIRLCGGQAERISNQGRIIDRRQTVTDCIGNKRVIGSIERVKSSMQRGTADISATIQGRSVKVEVKIGADRMSEYQIQYRQQVEAAGGIYFIARDFQSFYNWYTETFK